jgi:HEAT repeat protein
VAAETPRPEAPAEAAPDLPAGYLELHNLLRSDDMLIEGKHEIVVDELAPDPSPDATTVLLIATRNKSLPISMASLTALADREDPRIEPHLIGLLDDPAWQRRAWAARVLGQNGSTASLEPLTSRLEDESDARVRRQIEEAVASLSRLAGTGDPDDTEGTGG